MILSSFISELLQDKGVHPHQVNIVVDHGSCSSAALSSPMTERQSLGAILSPRFYERESKHRWSRIMNHSTSDSSLYVQPRRYQKAVTAARNSRALLRKRQDTFLQKQERSTDNNGGSKNSTWNMMAPQRSSEKGIPRISSSMFLLPSSV
jgi:hypothetical protein